MGVEDEVQAVFPSVQVSAEKKPTSSTVGMQTSVETSPLLRVRPVRGRCHLPRAGHTPHCPCPSSKAELTALLDMCVDAETWVGADPEPVLWLLCCEAARASLGNALALQFRAEAVVPARMAEMTRYIKERDFQGFGQLTMKDSNQFHATCLDTFPPISYLNDVSRRIIHLVHCFNTHHGQTKARRGRGGPGDLWSGLAAVSFSHTVVSQHTLGCDKASPHLLYTPVCRALTASVPLFHFGCLTL